ncbi:PQQ-binding-like beta-propeller repeat protein [Deinococcus aluminii]|uniref:Outer membrane protein assembly factor BamB n=1 Tax=Deinococcus aluminii TaxID=1656885 RepID=A0ABP9XFP0_9DEIO
MTSSLKARYAAAGVLGLGGLTALTLALAATPASSASGSRSGPPFTAAQAKSGQQVYTASCQNCHGQQLQGGAGPALKGASFLSRWDNKPLSDLYNFIAHQMPLNAPGSLSQKQYLDVTAYILAQNGFTAGSKALDQNALSTKLTSSGDRQQVQVPSQLPAPSRSVRQAVSTLPTQATLLKAADSDDWLMYNRDYLGQRYSPLDQITAANAGKLQRVCQFKTGQHGAFQVGPVEMNGVLYFTNAHSTFAINAANCNRQWTSTYTPRTAEPQPVDRGVALYDGKLFRGTTDGHLIALDKNTGGTLWDVWVANSNQGYFLSSAPIVWDGKVFIGEAGADWGTQGHVYAFDADTGKLIWTFDVIPTGDQPGADTWDKATTTAHGGGSMWTSYTLDPASGLLYVSVGNPAPDFAGDYRPGKNLYTDSVVVLNAQTGKLAWYAQQIANDYHDWDTAAAPVVYNANGKKYMAVADKGGHLYMYDRATHDRLNMIPVTTISNSDAPLTTDGTRFCPGTLGGVEWNGPAYDPQTNTLYVNSVDWCATIKIGPVRYNAGSVFTGTTNGFGTFDPRAKANGWTHAIDASTGDIKWKREAGSPLVAAVTPTAGGVLFTGDQDGNFLVLNAKDGQALYKAGTGGSVAGGVITYKLGDRQYVAVVSGNTSRTIWNTAGDETVLIYALPQGTQ